MKTIKQLEIGKIYSLKGIKNAYLHGRLDQFQNLLYISENKFLANNAILDFSTLDRQKISYVMEDPNNSSSFIQFHKDFDVNYDFIFDEIS